MSIKFCSNKHKVVLIEDELFNKDESDPENIIKPQNYISRSSYLFEIIRHEEIIDIIVSSPNFKLNQKFYISTWDEDVNIYEIVFEKDIKADYITFMYEPDKIPSLIQPKYTFGIMHEEIFIFNENKSIAIVANRYHDVAYMYLF